MSAQIARPTRPMRVLAISGAFPGILLLICVLVAAPLTRAQSGSEVLTNDSVISMVKAGLGTNVIVTKIRTSKTRFNLTTNELIRLKESGINEEVLMAMLGFSESADPPTTETRSRSVGVSDPNDPNNPLTAHDVGIYLYTEKMGQTTMTELESNAVTGR